MSQQVYGPFACTVCGKPGYIDPNGVLPYCDTHHASRKAKRERTFKETLHPSTMHTANERKAAYYAEKRRQREQNENDLVRQVDDDDAEAWT